MNRWVRMRTTYASMQIQSNQITMPILHLITFQNLLMTIPWYLNPDLKAATCEEQFRSMNSSMILSWSQTMAPEGTPNGTTSGSRTQDRAEHTGLTSSTFLNQIVSIIMACSHSCTQKSKPVSSERAGSATVKMFAITRTQWSERHKETTIL